MISRVPLNWILLTVVASISWWPRIGAQYRPAFVLRHHGLKKNRLLNPAEGACSCSLKVRRLVLLYSKKAGWHLLRVLEPQMNQSRWCLPFWMVSATETLRARKAL